MVHRTENERKSPNRDNDQEAAVDRSGWERNETEATQHLLAPFSSSRDRTLPTPTIHEIIMDFGDLKRDFLASMSDETLIDVRLVGTDEVEVPCTKNFLAARSEVFKAMFNAGFRENHSRRVDLNYPSQVIRFIVRYCYTDDLDFDLILDGKGVTTDRQATMLIQLRDAARFFGLDKVVHRVEQRVGDLVFQKNQTKGVCSMLTELLAEGDDGPFWEILFKFATLNPVECLKLDQGSPETYCSPSLLQRLLGKIDDTYLAVRCLQAWSAKESETTGGSADKEEECILAISNHVDLRKLSTNQLASMRDHCPVFPMERIHEAFVHHGRLSQTTPFALPGVTLQKPQAHVAGAGVQNLNGLYEQVEDGKTRFEKDGCYGGLPSKFVLEYVAIEQKWRINVVPAGKHSWARALPMYGATGNASEAPAFNDWICCEGAKPAPYVAVIKPGKQLPPQAPFKFGAIGSRSDPRSDPKTPTPEETFVFGASRHVPTSPP